ESIHQTLDIRPALPRHNNTMVSIAVSSLGDQMAAMIRAKDNGIHKSFTCSVGGPPNDPHGGVTVRFGGRDHPGKQAVFQTLSEFRGNTKIKFLLPFQVQAVLNMAFRPAHTFVAKTIFRNRNYGRQEQNRTETQIGTNVLKSFDDDVGMMAINDLYTGSGKTLTTILGAIVFADKRRAEITARAPFLVREQVLGNWSTRVQCSLSKEHQRPSSTFPSYTNVIVVMCAKHLFSQWKSACASALHVLGMEGVRVLENPLPGSTQLSGMGLTIVLLHSATNLTRLGLEFVPVIVVDEFTIKSASNVLTKPAETLPLHGRMILVSADAGNVKDIIRGSNRRSFLRKMLQWDDTSHLPGAHIAMVVGIPLISASVLQTTDRYAVGGLMIDQLRKVGYERYTVGYTPSFASRIFGNNFEMSAVSGSRLISERFGINLTGTKSIGQVLRIVSDTIDSLCATDANSRAISPLTDLKNKISAFVGEKENCPICLEEYEMGSGASLINPCWHIVCDKCLRAMMAARYDTCPLCRVKMAGHTTAVMDDGSVTSDVSSRSQSTRVETSSRLSLLQNMEAVLKPTSGLEKACIDTLRCIKADVGDQPYKIVMIVPDEHFFTKFAIDVREEMTASQIGIIEFKTIGNKRKHVTGKMVSDQIALFASNRGPPMKILFTTEGKTDSLTGLDFPTVDCILSLGDGNSLQRLGRLTRLPRVMDEARASKTVRYICLEPVS
ncbi:unnamed protein product, partial [Ectocarpus sp. 8 AP-2014]